MAEQKPNFRFIDLFSGIGGFHCALSDPAFGGQCVLAAEIDSACREVYSSKWVDVSPNEFKFFRDIREITRNDDGTDRSDAEVEDAVPQHDVLCAGFPCQPFSKSGAQMGVRDRTRGTLFYDILRIVQARRPRFLILENVRNLAGPRHRDTWKTIIDSLRSLQYRVSDEPVVVSPHTLPKEQGGRPQLRDRVFILASYAPGRHEENFPPLIHQDAPQEWNIQDFLIQDSSDSLDAYRLRPEEVAWLDAWQHFIQKTIRDDHLPGFPIWVEAFKKRLQIPRGTPSWKSAFLQKNYEFYKAHEAEVDHWMTRSWMNGSYTVRDFPLSRQKFEWQARAAQQTANCRDLWKLVIQMRPSGIRVKPATYLPALVAINQTSIIGAQRRRITPVEAARLQGLPDDIFDGVPTLEDAAKYKQVGNGVNVGVVRHVARALFASEHETWGQPDQDGSNNNDTWPPTSDVAREGKERERSKKKLVAWGSRNSDSREGATPSEYSIRKMRKGAQ